MRKITSVLNSPAKIAGFGIAAVILIVALIFATINVGAGVNTNKVIGLEKGTNIALQDAGFKQDKVANLVTSFTTEDGVAAYEVDFEADGYEYDYLVKASDGTVLEAKREAIEEPQLPQQSDHSGESAAASDSKTEVKPDADKTQTAEPAKKPDTDKTPAKQEASGKPASSYIGVDKAKSIALQNAGVKSSAATFVKAKLDREDGIMVYEIEFYTADKEFEYEINATSGKIRDKDVEFFEYDDNDWDDDEWDD